MRSVEFNYARHRQRDIPLVPVSLRTGGKWSEVWAYVDSGSFYSLFDDKVADLLDLELREGERVLAVVGDGSFIPVYLHKVGMRIGVDEFGVRIGFSSKLGVGLNGRELNLESRFDRETFEPVNGYVAYLTEAISGVIKRKSDNVKISRALHIKIQNCHNHLQYWRRRCLLKYAH